LHPHFFLKSTITSGFFLKCSAFRSPNSQRFDSAFTAFSALTPTALSNFLASISPNVVPSDGSTRLVFQMLGVQKPNTHGLRASHLIFSCEAREIHLAKILMTKNVTPIEVGKYLVSPTAKAQGEGRFAASVSIRSGRGSASHDRVLRFSAIFDSAAAAVHYATEYALAWIRESSSPVCA